MATEARHLLANDGLTERGEMLNVGNRRREAEQRGPGVSKLSMYREPPLVEVSLEEFEGFAIDRLHGARPIARAREMREMGPC